ncbi:MAG: hypothetical protein LBU34_06090 [Planctomycetaceae bacterium]|jgi:hypothetical protein|nr:hypothetical protein [Planctomycetaceae bacterium]
MLDILIAYRQTTPIGLPHPKSNSHQCTNFPSQFNIILLIVCGLWRFILAESLNLAILLYLFSLVGNRSVHFTINNSQGRQPLGESPSP